MKFVFEFEFGFFFKYYFLFIFNFRRRRRVTRRAEVKRAAPNTLRRMLRLTRTRGRARTQSRLPPPPGTAAATAPRGTFSAASSASWRKAWGVQQAGDESI